MNRKKLQNFFSSYVKGAVPQKMRDTFLLRAFGLFKIPLLFSVRPSVLELTDERAVVQIKLSRWTRNHWGSMYFGALAIGADCVVGMLAQHHLWCREADHVGLLFKDFQANFLKRPDGHVLFICDEGKQAAQLVDAALKSEERQNRTLKARAVSAKNPEEVVAEFSLTLSLKRKTKQA